MSTHNEKLRRPASAATQAHSPRLSLPPQAPQAVKSGTQSGGTALDKTTQNKMSAQFGHDFSRIRIHTDHRAGDAAEAMGANAFALGGDIVFGAGKYQPGSRETERLLAHELTHIVQQSQSGHGDWGRASRKGDASEREADSLTSQVMMGHAVQVQAAPGAAVARDPDVDFGGAEVPPEDFARPTGAPVEDVVRPNLRPVEGGDMPPGLENPVEIPGSPRLPSPGTLGDYDYLLEGTGAGSGAAEGAGVGLGAEAILPLAAAGAAGVGAGMLLDAGANKLGQKISGDDQGDYSISNGLAHLMTGADNLATNGLRDTGVIDNTQPEYTQTIGMKLANLFTPTADASGKQDSFTDRLGQLF